MALHVKFLPAVLAFHVRALVPVPLSLIPTKLFVNVPGNTVEGVSRTWAYATYMGRHNEITDAWLWSGPVPINIIIWGVNHYGRLFLMQKNEVKITQV